MDRRRLRLEIFQDDQELAGCDGIRDLVVEQPRHPDTANCSFRRRLGGRDGEARYDRNVDCWA